MPPTVARISSVRRLWIWPKVLSSGDTVSGSTLHDVDGEHPLLRAARGRLFGPGVEQRAIDHAAGHAGQRDGHRQKKDAHEGAAEKAHGRTLVRQREL